MAKIIDDPQKETGLPTYPQEFSDEVKAGAKNLASHGVHKDQILGWMTEKYKRYNNEHKGSDVQYEEKPEWAESSRIEMKNTKKKRGLINRIGRGLSTIQVIPTVGGVRFFNPLKGEDKEDKDVINEDMVNKTDERVQGLLNKEGRRDGSIDVKEHIEETRKVLATEFNSSGHRTQRYNNEILMEEAYSEVIAKEFRERLVNIEKETGISKADIILTDPKKIKKMKKQYRDMGYTGVMVDRAFDKVLYEDKRETFAEEYDNSIIKNNDRKVLEQNREAIGGSLYNSYKERAEGRFNPNELDRMQANIRLEELRTQKADPKTIKAVEDEIAVLDDLLGEDKTEKAARHTVSYATAVYMPGGMSTPSAVKVGTEEYENEVFYRFYNKDGTKIMRGDETQDEIEHEQSVTEIIKANKEINDLPEKLLQEGIKSEKILLILEQKLADIDKKFSDYQEAKTLTVYGTSKQKEEGLDPEALKAFDRANEYKRTRALISEEIRQENIRSEAVSRMYLLNQNVALEDRNLKTLTGLGAATIRDINIMPFKSNPNPSIEQVRAYVNPIYEELGIEMDSKEYKATVNTLTTDIIEGGAHLTDIAIKMMLLDKVGFAGVTKFFDLIGKGGVVYKAGAGLFKMGIEEVKFRAVGGDPGTGAAFYAANSLIPNIKFSKKWLDVIVNGYMKSSVGMAGAIEGASLIESGIHAAAKDDDVIREMTETFGPTEEWQRRVLVNVLSATPFGIKGMYARGAMPMVDPAKLRKIATDVENNGKHDASAQLKSMAATLGDTKVYEAYKKGQHKVARLKANNRYDRSDNMEDINKKYEELVSEEGQNDALQNPGISAILGKYDNVKVEFDAREYAGKIKTLRLNGFEVTEKTSPATIDTKYAEIIRKSNDFKSDIKESIPPESETENIIDVKPKAKAIEYESENKVRAARKGIESIVKDVEWKKAIKGPAKHIAKTIKALKAKIDGEASAGVERPDVKLKVEETKDGKFTVTQQEGEKTEFKSKEKAEQFIKDFELLTGGERTFEEQKRITNEKQGKSEERVETFDEIIERFSGLKNGTRELDAMVNMLFEAEKGEAVKIASKIEDIVHKVEVMSRPKVGTAEAVTRSPNQGQAAVSRYADFRGNLIAYKRGQREGRTDLTERANEVYDYIKTRMSSKLVEKILTATEVKSLAKPLPKNASTKDVLARIEKMEKLFQKLETRQFRADILKKLRGLSPKVVGANLVETKVGEIGGSEILTADILFKNNIEGAESVTAKLNTLRKNFKEGEFGIDFIDAHINALRWTGSRELAMERQAQLEAESVKRELSLSEKMEYELLGLTDGSKMNNIDALRAKETIDEIERSGRLVQERVNESKKIINSINIEEGLVSLNADPKKIKEQAQINPNKPGFGEAVIQKIKDASKYVGTSHESFITMMEMLSSNDPNREGPWDGFFHTISKDFHRSRERETAEKNRMLNTMREELQVITGLKGKKFDKWSKRNSKKVHPFVYDIANEVQEVGNGITVDQAARYWQLLHNKATYPLWAKRGFGVKGEKFTEVEGKRLMDALEDFVVTNNGDKKALEVAKYQMDKYAELYRDVNEVYSSQHGIDLGYTFNYVPIVFEQGIILDAKGREISLDSENNMLDRSSETRVASSAPVFTKATQRSGSIKLDLSKGSEEVFVDYLSHAMHYKHFQEPLRRADNVLNDSKIKKAIQGKYGEKAGKYVSDVIAKSLKDIGADAAGGTKIKWLATLKNKFTVANLGANVILLPKQLMSVDAYRAGLQSPAEEALFTKHLMSFMVDGWGAMGELNRSEMMVNRAAGHSYNKELLEMQKKAAKLYKVGKLRPGNLNEGLLFATKLGDRTAILIGGQALYRTKQATYRAEGMSESAAKQKAYEDVVTFTKLTQQSGNIEDLGHIQRSGTLGKYATLFQNTPQQYYRVEIAAIRNGANAARRNKNKDITPEERERNKTTIRRSARDFAIYHFILPMTFRAASQGFYLGGDDKGRDRFINDEGQIVTSALGSFAYPFMLGDVMTNILSLAITGHSFKTEIGGVAQDVISGTEEMVKTAIDIFQAEEFQFEWARIMDGTSAITWADIMNVLGTGAEYAGIPWRSPALIVKGISDYRNYKTEDIRSWFGYSSGVMGHYDRSPQFNTMAPYFGSEEGIEPFLAKMRLHTDPDYYEANQEKWRKEFRLYNHFGGYNDDVNYLYTLSKTNKHRAKYLRSIRDGKIPFGAPISIGDLVRASKPPMNPAQYNAFQTELLEFGVITKEVITEMNAQDIGYKKEIVPEFRKTGR